MKKLLLKIIRIDIFKIIPDKLFIKIYYWLIFNKKINLQNPRTFSEKLNWIKLYDRNPQYTIMADKYLVKEYISKKIKEGYTFKTLGIYDNFEQINIDKLPKKFVMKTTHDSGGVIVCTNKSTFDFTKAQIYIKKHLKTNWFNKLREWPYKNINPKIMIEEYMGENLTDYRIYCFNGKPLFIYQYLNENDGVTKPEPKYCNVYNTKWEKQDFRNFYLPDDIVYDKPKELDNMLEISKKLCGSTKFLRVDFYIINNKVYVGELTFFPGGGFSKFYPEKADLELGNLIDLEK